ncbi:hypothetical protein [Haladaptatus sp. NG-SE-30]
MLRTSAGGGVRESLISGGSVPPSPMAIPGGRIAMPLVVRRHRLVDDDHARFWA